MGGDKDECFTWLRNNNHGEVIVEQVNASSLSRVARELAEEGRELPDNLFKSDPTVSTSITKVKAK